MTRALGVRVLYISLLSAAVLVAPVTFTKHASSANEQTSARPAASTDVRAITHPAAHPTDNNEARETRDVHEARWKNGELLSPLPRDPARRAEAIRQAIRLAESRGTSTKWESVPSMQVRQTRAQPVPTDPVRITGRQKPVGRSMAARPSFRPTLSIPDAPYRPTPDQLSEANKNLIQIEVPQPSATALGSFIAFDAIDDTGETPASPDIAVGPDQVLVATTEVFAVYDKCGNWVDGGDFSQYMGLLESYTYYDPRVIYDDWDGRWLMAYIGNDFGNDEAYVFVAVSVSDDLRDGWAKVYWVDVGHPGDFADNMFIALDPVGVYVTFNEYDFVTYNFDGATIVALEKADMYAGHHFPTTYLWGGLTNPSDATLASAIRPAQMRSYPGEVYLLNNKPNGGDFFTIWLVIDMPSAPTLLRTYFNVNAYATPPHMQQPDGSYVDVGDCRFTDLVYNFGKLYGAFTRYYFSGSSVSAVTVSMVDVASLSVQQSTNSYLTGGFLAYPAIDIDENGYLTMVYAACAPVPMHYLWANYNLFRLDPWDFIVSGNAAIGRANYTTGGSGTPANPYRWGHYFGVARDPVDDRTMWTHCTYASDDPIPSWTTRVGAYSSFSKPNLEVTPASGDLFAGYEGGPFHKDTIDYTLTNTGGATVNWELSGVPSWLTASRTEGQIPPGGSEQVTLAPGTDAYTLPVGSYAADIEFDNCTGDGGGTRNIMLIIASEQQCPGTVLHLGPDMSPPYKANDGAEMSLFVTAITDIDVCAIGIQADLPDPGTITGRIHEADGTTRGTLISELTLFMVEDTMTTHYIPMSAHLETCRDYEIVFVIANGQEWTWWQGIFVHKPYDIGGVIRVRDIAENGTIIHARLPYMTVVGTASSEQATYCDQSTDLWPESPPFTTSDSDAEVGYFVTARDNLRLCSLGLEADIARGTQLTARVYAATGTTRLALIAEGTTTVTAGGTVHHEISVHANLSVFEDYNVSVDFERSALWPVIDENDVTLPYGADGAFIVQKGEFNGSESTLLPHMWVKWDGIVSGGVPFDLAKIADGVPPPYSASTSLDYGAYVVPHGREQVFGVGVMADIPEGELIQAAAYPSVNKTRIELYATGEIRSVGSGMRWHDIPLPFEAPAGSEVDISIQCTNVNEYRYWDDTSGLPYASYGGAWEVLDGEQAGDSNDPTLIHLRVHGCDEVLTAVGDGPTEFVPMYLAPPSPNPAKGTITFNYSVDQPGVIDLEVYNVLGRRVGQVFNGHHVTAGPGVADFDTSTLASGVYFVKLRTMAKTVARKFVVTH